MVASSTVCGNCLGFLVENGVSGSGTEGFRTSCFGLTGFRLAEKDFAGRCVRHCFSRVKHRQV